MYRADLEIRHTEKHRGPGKDTHAEQRCLHRCQQKEVEPCPPILTEVGRHAPGWTYRDAHTCTDIERYVHMDTCADRWKCIDTHPRILTDVYTQAAHLHTDVQTHIRVHTHTDTQMYMLLCDAYMTFIRTHVPRCILRCMHMHKGKLKDTLGHCQ